MTDLLEKQSKPRTPKKRHKNTRTADEGRFGEKSWSISFHSSQNFASNNTSAGFTQASRFEVLGYTTVFTQKSRAVFVPRAILYNGWRARGTADFKIHTRTSPDKPVSSLQKRKCLYFTLQATRNVFTIPWRISCQLTNVMTVRAWEGAVNRWLALSCSTSQRTPFQNGGWQCQCLRRLKLAWSV